MVGAGKGCSCKLHYATVNAMLEARTKSQLKNLAQRLASACVTRHVLS